MNRLKKEEWVDDLRSKLDSSSLIVVTQPLGLTVSEATSLRFKMKSEDAEFKVIKNTLAAIAVQGKAYGGLSDLFKGPVALAYSKDPIAAARIVAKYAKDNKKMSILGGFMDGKVLSQAQVHSLASLPSKDELRAKLIALISASATKLAILLKEPASRVARVLSARSEGAEATEQTNV